jgi:hypothetical protein
MAEQHAHAQLAPAALLQEQPLLHPSTAPAPAAAAAASVVRLIIFWIKPSFSTR